ncbi:hypothetical protein CVT24_010862 [Panaeolus cyanescens]|uniref:Uncharacterized protein n=1 Tax=Panaeolus cyanescens TaxID=181874 RepID=A0A409WAQ2_9AGAR|nr:hypothetical protein CVT24_010862 [Panaeolus cyanescens]
MDMIECSTRPLSPALSLTSPALFSLLLVTSLITHASAQQEVVIDDNDPSIIYTPSDGWTEMDNPLDRGGSHMVTVDSRSVATFTFTGVQVTFWAPLWPSELSTSVSLDGGAPIRISLQDPNSPVDDNAGESVASAPLWTSPMLDNTQHTLVIGTWPGENVAVVDTLA